MAGLTIRRANMGIYDRDYQRGGNYYDRQPGFYLGAPRMMNTNIILVTCGLYIVQYVVGGWYDQTFALSADWYRRPWTAYQLLTYGFLHDPHNLWHIVLNMLGLFFFGRDVELRYGRREYLLFYLIGIVVSGLIWTIAEIPAGSQATMLGASGGVIAVVILFAFNFPYRTVLFMFFLPMPMWVAAVIFVVVDALGAMNVRNAGNVAVTAHLGGALYAFLYYRWGGRLERLVPGGAVLKRLRPRPKLRVHDPDADDHSSTDSRVDEILKKIQEHGQESLTYSERRILEEASREYQKKRR
jgi:membrane associated rhomboid family serine protease